MRRPRCQSCRWAAVCLASDEARWVTGQVLTIDAGITITIPGNVYS